VVTKDAYKNAALKKRPTRVEAWGCKYTSICLGG
jgi:hypothetical protein